MVSDPGSKKGVAEVETPGPGQLVWSEGCTETGSAIQPGLPLLLPTAPPFSFQESWPPSQAHLLSLAQSRADNSWQPHMAHPFHRRGTPRQDPGCPLLSSCQEAMWVKQGRTRKLSSQTGWQAKGRAILPSRSQCCSAKKTWSHPWHAPSPTLGGAEPFTGVGLLPPFLQSLLMRAERAPGLSHPQQWQVSSFHNCSTRLPFN